MVCSKIKIALSTFAYNAGKKEQYAFMTCKTKEHHRQKGIIIKNLITSLCVIKKNYYSTLLLFVEVIQIQSEQLVHIMLHDSHVIT